MMACYGAPSVLLHLLEGLYYAAGIAIAVAAFIGLGQLRLTREIAKTNAQREALKFAAERCQYFAEHTVPEHSKMAQAYFRARLTRICRTQFGRESRDGATQKAETSKSETSRTSLT